MRNVQVWGRVNSGKDLATLGEEQAKPGGKRQRAREQMPLMTPHGSDAPDVQTFMRLHQFRYLDV